MGFEVLIDLGTLPFQIGARDTTSNEPFPDELPFVAGFNGESGCVVQLPNSGVEECLVEAYQVGGQLPNLMDDFGLGKIYADDFLSFLIRQVPMSSVSGLDVLEVGCGNGYLLFRLAQMGARVLGIEPDRWGAERARRRGLSVIGEDFGLFESDRSFDLIVHSTVLEHIKAPRDFLERQMQLLKPDGLMIFSVPDESLNIEKGDLSIFCHQHWNYFTPFALEVLASSLRAQVIECCRSPLGKPLYSVWTHGCSKVIDTDDVILPTGFQDRVHANLSRLGDFVEQIMKGGNCLGIYCPCRALNYLHLIGCDYSRIRFFDDALPLRWKYFPPFPIPIEDRNALLDRPIDHILVMSYSFGRKIEKALRGYDQLRGVGVTRVDQLI